MSLEKLVFESVVPLEVPVQIAGAEYALREASGEAVAKWRNELLAGARLADGKVVGIGGMGDADPLLVSLCLVEKYEHNGDTKERPVPLAAVRRWPGRVVRELAERARALSGLDEETPEQLEERIKKDQERLERLRERGGVGKN